MLIFIDCKGIDVSFFMQYFKMSKMVVLQGGMSS